jgi:5-methylcytosine-specific restriction endonuclease McrA
LGKFPILLFFGDLMKTQKEYRNATMIRYKKWLQDLKINGCAICGYNKYHGALDFHHVNPRDKKFNLTIDDFRHKKSNIFIAEINKCILLCSNCHAEVEG